MRPYLLLILGLLSLAALCAAPDSGAASIDSARKSIQADPKALQGYLDLASALCRRARDSEDPADYTAASAALDHALEISPGNFDALKLRVVILLGRHDFTEALKQAIALNGKVHDDITVWGYLVDANMALGDYAAAEKDGQWILDLRRGSTLGYTKAAALREMFGDLEGAIEFYDEALLRTAPNDVEDRCSLMTRNARLQLASGNAKRARDLLEKALALNPESQFTRGILACLEASQGNFAAALSLARRRHEQAPTPDHLYQFAQMLEKAGLAAEAQAAFQKFEAQARAETTHTFNADRDLILYYADRRNSSAEALSIAARDAETRHDSETLDAYAWALFRSGKFAEAKIRMDRALSPGVRKGSYFCHARQIAAALQDADAVKRFEKELAALPAAVCPVSASSK
jgi:tetratricopeptide (TPR) repeat protein